jgi:predicted AAA+ superfamily ATPase
MLNRKILEYARNLSQSPVGRILVFTGARQTGKTTVTRHGFPEYTYISIEDPVLRGQYTRLTAAQWRELYPRAILDEVQKEPQLIESIKAVYDQWSGPRYMLLGSSQLLLLEKVRESLAGRCAIIELYPLTLPELETADWTEPVGDSLFQQFLINLEKAQGEWIAAPEILPSFLLDKKMAKKKAAWDYYLKFGGYPALTNPALSDEERYIWLHEYVRTYLERDIRDLASFRDLEPVIKLQRYLANMTAQVLNSSAAAVQLGLSVKTVQRYIHFFELSYQIMTIPAWSRNLNKRLVKAPKIHYLDNGVLQGVLEKQGGLTGHEFESLVAAEIYKQIRCAGAPGQLFHLRTHDGFEVDLLLELPQGYIAFEIKMADRIRDSDASGLKKLSAILDKPLLHGFLLSQDDETRRLDEHITALHGAYFLG